MVIYIINRHGRSLMPCKPRKARLLLKEGKAKVIKRTPFTLKLKYGSSEYTQNLNLGIDPGSKTVGTAVRRDGTKEIVYASEVELRTDIKPKMDKRKNYRRNRRNKKTRYRECRLLNRRRPEGWLPPTLMSKVTSTEKEIRFIFSILPVTRVIFEYSKFDTHKLANSKIWGYWYQRGPKFQFENTKAYVLHRDHYKCQCCKGKTKDPMLQRHHIKPKGKGGSDKPTNLITLCKTCHRKLHLEEISLSKRQLKVSKNTVDATQVSIISKRLLRFLAKESKEKGFKLVRTYGYLTKVKRRLLKLNKTHVKDAMAITYLKRDRYKKCLRKPVDRDNFYRKICVPKGDYQQTKGARSQQKIPTGKIQGFRKFDVVEYLEKTYIIKGRMSSGYAFLMDGLRKKVDLKPIPKFCNLKRIQARSSLITLI